MNDQELIYNLSIIENDKNIKIKSLIELDKEHNTSLQLLEKWADNLPNRVHN